MTKRAVLIGINEYEDSGVPDLGGCINDVEMMSALLTDSFGFGDVKQLVAQPDNTRDGIFAALDELIDSTDQGDSAIVYYSGHGSQAPDENDEEKDEYDETIVPSDSGRTNLPVRDIIDDELFSYVSALAQKTDRAYFIFDSCHSGSVDRGLLAPVGSDDDVTPRAIEPAATAPEGERRLRPEAADAEGAESQSGILRKGEYVLIAGCLDAQTSKETNFEGQRNGALTYYLAKALGSNGQRDLKSIFDEAVTGVTGSVDQQDPVLEGPDERLQNQPF